ncbi:hypothetical protein [Limnothrix redekei]|uniref:Transposase n=1 Tax=Limnothrix redekei LRLZ20PSL1 TaxID=3112953 RepID=A0ABW7CG78_9CYAN
MGKGRGRKDKRPIEKSLGSSKKLALGVLSNSKVAETQQTRSVELFSQPIQQTCSANRFSKEGDG